MHTAKRVACYCFAAVLSCLILLQCRTEWYRIPATNGPMYLSKFTGLTNTDFFDYNTLLNRGLDQEIFRHLGAYGVRYSVASNSPFPPAGCHVEVVNSLERHGARLMTSNALKNAKKTILKVQTALSNISESRISSELRFLKTATLLGETSSLVPYGALQAYYSGKSSAAVYLSLSHLPPFVRASGDEDLVDDRVILTAKYWRLGFTGGKFPLGLLRSAEDVRRAASRFPQPDVIFSELEGFNNTLDVSTCTEYNKVPSADGEIGAQAAFEKSTIIPIVGIRLESSFARAGVEGLQLTGQDLLNLAALCSFDTLGRATIKNGHLLLKQSAFCGVYKKHEWPILGYAFDVGKWMGQGYGSPYHKALGTGFLRELVARFNATMPPLSHPASLNTTIDGNPETFPFPNAVTGPVVYFDGSHDNIMAPIAAALGLFKGPDLTTSSNAQERPHNWIFSQLAPFQGKIVFEKLSCGVKSASFIRIRANGAVLSGWCGGDKHISMCPMSDDFLKQLSFVEDATEWDKCYAES